MLLLGLILCAATARADDPPPNPVPPPPPVGANADQKLLMIDGALDPEQYVVGPGDKLALALWGLREIAAELEVNAEGRLVIPHLGIFPARGVTLAALRHAVDERVHVTYPRLQGGITLVRPRSFLVRVLGAVTHPGAYVATPLTRVSELLAMAGGGLPNASTRRVEVRRQSPSTTLTADLPRATLLGQTDADPRLLDGDTLYVPVREIDVEVTGAVQRPGRYELVGTRQLAQLLELAGGLTAERARGLPVRVSSRGTGDRLAVRSVSAESAAAVELHDGDRVHVPLLGDLRRVVLVQGAVVGPPGQATELQRAPALVDKRADTPLSGPRELAVSLPFVDGDGVRDLVAKAGGLQPWADTAKAYLLRPAASGPPQRLFVDVAAIASGAKPDLLAMAGDTLVVPSRRDAVLVGGAVQHPGLYAFDRELPPQAYVDLAGGPTHTGNGTGARILGLDGKSRKLSRVSAVQPGEVITVPEKRITTVEWVSIAVVCANLIVAATAIGITAAR